MKPTLYLSFLIYKLGRLCDHHVCKAEPRVFPPLTGVIFLGLCVLSLGGGCVPDSRSFIDSRNSSNAPDAPIISRSGSLGMGIDRSVVTPLTARGRCLDLIISCHTATDEEQDRCVNQLRRCQTSQPWDESVSCCPSACVDIYLRERQNGNSAREANIVAFDQRGCYPGVERMIRGESWR